jgi:hypothetical protein
MTYLLPVLISFLALTGVGATPQIQAAMPESSPLELPSTTAPGRFLVECHCFIPASAGRQQDYGYHFRALGYPKSVPNGLEVTLDRNKIFLSVTRREAGQEDYRPLYESILPRDRAQQSCETGDCPLVEYEFPMPPEQIVVTYDNDNGVILVQHLLEDKTLLQGQGGCAFFALPAP